jgi:hypothetical protein
MPLPSRISLILLIGAALLAVSWGGSNGANPNPNHLLAAQAQQLEAEAYSQISEALTDAMQTVQCASAQARILAAICNHLLSTPTRNATTCDSSETSGSISD